MASTTMGPVDYTNVTTIKQETLPSFSSSSWLQTGNDELKKQRRDSFVSDGVVRFMDIAVLTILCGIISASGIVANVINILVFFRQGALSSSSNVSLLALAFADIGCLLPVFYNSINYALFKLGHVGIFLTPKDYFDALVIWPHIMCMQIASWITAYIAFERCICVLLPLKVKFLFSAKRSAIITVSIALLAIASFLPTFTTMGIAKIVDPLTNTTSIIFMPKESHMKTVAASDILHAFILRPLTLLIVLVCTQITIYRVKLSASWRKSMVNASAASSSSSTTTTTTTTKANENSSFYDLTPTASSKISGTQTNQTCNNSSSTEVLSGQAENSKPESSNLKSKETRLVKMISVISLIFMVCNAPDILGVFILFSLAPKYNLTYADNVFSVIVAAMLCLESINSAINIIVYYKMSSSYKQAFLVLMRRK